MSGSLSDKSKELWSTRGGVPTENEIHIGCMQRIAAAMELIAKDKASLEFSMKWYKEQHVHYITEIEQLTRSNAALRGVITKMKKNRESE